MEFKEFRVGDLFNLKAMKQAKSQKNIIESNIGVPYVVQSQHNNMVSKYVDKRNLIDTDEPISKGNVLALGVTLPACSYQPKEFGCSQIIIASSHFLNEKIGLYILTLLKQQMNRFSYQNKPGLTKYSELTISLPVKTTLTPDFSTLEAILTGGGIDMSSIDTSNWKEFTLEELFNIRTTKSVDKNKINFTDDGLFDFIGRSSVNNGIQGKVESLEFKPNPKNTFSLVQVGESIMLYRENDWYASQNIFLLQPLYKEICDNHLFFETMVNKLLEPYKEAYIYPKLSDLLSFTIKLPVKETEEIDYEFMENYIKAIEKLVIKDVIKMKDRELEITKEIIEEGK